MFIERRAEETAERQGRHHTQGEGKNSVGSRQKSVHLDCLQNLIFVKVVRVLPERRKNFRLKIAKESKDGAK